MRLNHLDLQVPDVPALATFLVEHFELEPVTRPDSDTFVLLTDGHGFSLVLQRTEHPHHRYPEGFHIGFLVADPAEVHARRAHLAAAGVSVSEVDSSAGATACFCHAPGPLVIEISHRGGPRPPEP